MLISHGNLYAKVERATEEEMEWLRDYLSLPDAKARFRTGGSGDGRIHMFNELAKSFAAGFLPGLVKSAKLDGFQVHLFDKRTAPVQRDANADLAWLRDYQTAAVDAVATKVRGLLHYPTGSGKTDIMVGLVRALPCRWLALVHRAQLAGDIAARFNKRNEEHGVDLGEAGVIGEGQWAEGRHLTAATFQTMAHGLKRRDERVLNLLHGAEGVLVDEAHTLPAESFYEVAMATPRAYFRVGLSGTPLARGDRRSAMAIGALGPVIGRVKAETLIDAGVLAKPKIRMVTVTQPTLGHTWNDVYRAAVVSSARRNAVLLDMMKRAAAEGPSLCFVKEVRHGRVLTKMAEAAGLRTAFTFGNHTVAWRQALAKRLVSGSLDILVCSVVFQEGIDIPELRALVIGSGGKSVIAALQRVGRGTRRTAGKEEFQVWDVYDRGDAWLEKHAKDRRDAYAREGYETVIEPESVVGMAVAAGKEKLRRAKGSCAFCSPDAPCENCAR